VHEAEAAAQDGDNDEQMQKIKTGGSCQISTSSVLQAQADCRSKEGIHVLYTVSGFNPLVWAVAGWR